MHCIPIAWPSICLVVDDAIHSPITVILVHADLGLNTYNEHNSLTYVSCIILFLKKQVCTQRGRGLYEPPAAVRGPATGSYKKYQDGNPTRI